MTLSELTNIIRTADEKAIKSELKRLGYVYCNKHKKLGKLNIVELFNGDEQQTEDFIDKKHKFVYDGCITTNVKGYAQYEFVTVTICEIHTSATPFEEEKAIQTDMLIYAKELEK